MKTVGIVIARMGSTRLPGKVLMDLNGVPVLACTVNAVLTAVGVDDVVVATTTDIRDDAIVEWCINNGISYFCGSENDVLARFTGAAAGAKADVVIRVTADCPFLDPAVIGEVIALRNATDADYASNVNPPTYPDGLDCEVFKFSALKVAHNRAVRPTDRECVTQYIMRNKDMFHIENATCPVPGLHKERFVLDTADDLKFCQEIAKRLIRWPASYLDILKILDKEPELRKLNAGHPRNERFYEAIATEKVDRDFKKSRVFLKKAEEIIPLATQTFSKSKIQFPPEFSPLFLSHGDGGYVYDLDGNDYVDLVGALLPVVLGYRDPDVDHAIRSQLASGISFSLASELEYKLAETLVRLIPCAEMVRFGKNGSDVTTAAIRLARYHSGRDHIVLAGYHGWHDWAIGWDPERNRGVPAVVRGLSHKVNFGDIAEVEHLLKKRNVAAVIVEPDGGGHNDNQYLKDLRELCNKHDAILIFDEIITGFRWDLGGYQKLCGVTPDLATFGKSMANGMPISALVGRKDIMKFLPRVCYSGTFFGETLSIAAAIATLDKIEKENVCGKLWLTGTDLSKSVQAMLDDHGLETAISLYGDMPLRRLEFSNARVKTLFLKEMIASGTLLIASHNIMAAHGEPQLKRVLNSYSHALSVVADSLKKNDIDTRIATSIPENVSVR